MNSTSGFQEVRSSPPDHQRIGSCTTNGINPVQVPGIFPVLTSLSLSPQASAQRRIRFLTSFPPIKKFRAQLYLKPKTLHLAPIFFFALTLAIPTIGESLLLAGENTPGPTHIPTATDFQLMLEERTRSEIQADARLVESVKNFGYFTVDTQFIDKYVVMRALAGGKVSPVKLELFTNSRKSFTVSVKHVEEIPPPTGQGSVPKVHSWDGSVKEDPNGLAVFIVKNGTLYGSIWARGRVYRIRPVGGAIHEVLEIDPSKYPDGMKAGTFPLNEHTSALLGPHPHHPIDDVLVQFPCIIDVMVLYTSALYPYGDQNTKLSEMWYDANLSILVANDILERSGIIHRLHLVHVAELSRVVEVGNGRLRRESYSEDGKGFDDILSDFLNPVSGSIPEDAATWRRDHHADLVSIQVYKPHDPFCGMAYPMDPPDSTFAPSAYSVVDFLCGWVRFDTLHEMAHNMGAFHDRSTEGQVDAGGSPHFGHINWATKEATIMSERVSSGCSDCIRLPYFSNPSNSSYTDGSAMGVPPGYPNAADNAFWLNHTGSIVSSFEAPTTCRPPISHP
jgi:hypothetical protein